MKIAGEECDSFLDLEEQFYIVDLSVFHMMIESNPGYCIDVYVFNYYLVQWIVCIKK